MRLPFRFRSLTTRGFSSRAAALVSLTALALGAIVAAGPASQASPVEPLFAKAIDGYSPYEGQTTCVDHVQPGVAAFRSFVLPYYPGTGYGQDVRPCDQGGQSEHKDGRAWDWTIPDGHQRDAENLLAWLLASDSYGNKNALLRRFGIMYIIWNRQIWRAYDPGEGWQPYDGADPHTSHVHFSFGWDGALEKTSWFTDQKTGLLLDQAGIGVAWRDKDHLDLVRRGADGSVEQRTWNHVWSGWQSIGGEVDSAPTAVWISKTTLWVLGTNDGALVTRRWSVDGGWTNWDSYGSALKSGVSVAVKQGRLDVFGVAAAGNVIQRTWRQGAWSDWIDLGGTVSATPAGVWRTPHELDVYARGSSTLFARTWSGKWGTWVGLGGAVTSGPSATSLNKGTVDLFARSPSGSIETRQYSAAGYSAWSDLGGFHSSAPRVDVLPRQRIDVFTRRVDGLTYQDRYFPDSGWLGWVVP